MSSALD